ncbi:MAG: hypothetical protein L3J28_05125 [Candidatus Polarisedimenticolaceae bacterium]|nr:hypothetical protein [Candidatus Polarisedimenticolaceae bacterium]
MKKILLLKILMLLLLAGASLNSHATVVVSFDTRGNTAIGGPLGWADSFSGSFELDDTVSPIGTLNDFNGALDNFSITIDGQTFGGTDGRHRQLTNGDGTGGFLSGRLNNALGSTFGSYNGYDFVGMTYDFRGAAADFFPDSNPANMANNISRDALGNDFAYALMYLNFNDSFGNSYNTMRIGFDTLLFSDGGAVTAPTPVPAPATLVLLLAGLPLLLKRRLNKRLS